MALDEPHEAEHVLGEDLIEPALLRLPRRPRREGASLLAERMGDALIARLAALHALVEEADLRIAGEIEPAPLDPAELLHAVVAEEDVAVEIEVHGVAHRSAGRVLGLAFHHLEVALDLAVEELRLAHSAQIVPAVAVSGKERLLHPLAGLRPRIKVVRIDVARHVPVDDELLVAEGDPPDLLVEVVPERIEVLVVGVERRADRSALDPGEEFHPGRIVEQVPVPHLRRLRAVVRVRVVNVEAVQKINGGGIEPRAVRDHRPPDVVPPDPLDHFLDRVEVEQGLAPEEDDIDLLRDPADAARPDIREVLEVADRHLGRALLEAVVRRVLEAVPAVEVARLSEHQVRLGEVEVRVH